MVTLIRFHILHIRLSRAIKRGDYPKSVKYMQELRVVRSMLNKIVEDLIEKVEWFYPR